MSGMWMFAWDVTGDAGWQTECNFFHFGIFKSLCEKAIIDNTLQNEIKNLLEDPLRKCLKFVSSFSSTFFCANLFPSSHLHPANTTHMQHVHTR
jgi:hypothetical protein